jgi:hypothetical protein
MKPWMIKLMPNVLGITLCPFGIYLKRPPKKVSKATISHEEIHWHQQIEMLVIPFYMWYCVEYLIKLLKYKGAAYYNISFEREAYTNETSFKYVENRELYSWFKYL